MNIVQLEKMVLTPSTAEMESRCRRLWAMVILEAIADKATEIRFEPWRNKNILCYMVNGVNYEMIPPPRVDTGEFIKAICSLDQPPHEENWQTRLARKLRDWADWLDPLPFYHDWRFEYSLDIGSAIMVRNNPAGEATQWTGVVIRLVPDQAASEKAKQIFAELRKASGDAFSEI